MDEYEQLIVDFYEKILAARSDLQKLLAFDSVSGEGRAKTKAMVLKLEEIIQISDAVKFQQKYKPTMTPMQIPEKPTPEPESKVPKVLKENKPKEPKRRKWKN